jgi:SRSO17 transposase
MPDRGHHGEGEHHQGDVFFATWCPAGTSIETLVAVEGHRWAIEDSFETAKNEFGLNHNESRSWHGWHRQRQAGDVRDWCGVWLG